jgi:preprotein translocase subunit SecD
MTKATARTASVCVASCSAAVASSAAATGSASADTARRLDAALRSASAPRPPTTAKTAPISTRGAANFTPTGRFQNHCIFGHLLL